MSYLDFIIGGASDMQEDSLSFILIFQIKTRKDFTFRQQQKTKKKEETFT